MNEVFINDWKEALSDELDKPYYIALKEFMVQEYTTQQVFPAAGDLYNALHLTPLSKVKVLLLGQDPYHDDGQAHGLSFSVKPGIKCPPSLVNIYKELVDDLGLPMPITGCLEPWAKEGVLLLNTVLSVRAHQANSHQGKGWELFTDAIIQAVNQQDRPLVIFLWGKPAQKKRALLNNPNHLVLEAPHPSPLSSYRGFFGSKPFSKANDFLVAHGEKAIDWSL